MTPEEHAFRRSGLGASDIPIIMGASPWCTQYKLKLIKTGQLEPDPDNEITMAGKCLEDGIGKLYAWKFNKKLRAVPRMMHPKHKILWCSLDRKIHGERRFIEIKKVNPFAFASWGEEGSDEIPESYIWQMQAQYASSGYKETAELVAYGSSLMTYPIPRDEVLIKRLETDAAEWWNEYIIKDNEPPMTSREDVLLKYPHNLGKLKVADFETIGAIDSYKDVRQKIKELEEQKDIHSLNILKAITDADALIDIEENVLATWKARKDGVRMLRVK